MKKSFILFTSLLFSLFANAQLSWLQMAAYPGGKRCGTVSFSINNKGYMGLGTDSAGNFTTDFYQYDPVGNSWTQMASLPSFGRAYCVSLTIDAKGYVITGERTGGTTNENYEYDPVANIWTSKSPMPVSGRMNAAGFTINGMAYVGTGYAGISYTDFYAYDPVTDMWSQKADFPGIARNGCSAFSAGSNGFMGMGNTSGNNYPNDFYMYDPTLDTWTQKANFPLPWGNGQTTYSSSTTGYVLCGYFFQATGITHNPLNMYYKYEPVNDAWTLLGTFPGLPRGYASGFALANDIYIGCGSQSNGGDPRLDDVWKLSNGILLSVVNNNHDKDFIISPNPALKQINFDCPEGKHAAAMRIYDEQGKLVTSLMMKDKRFADISMLNSGLYFVELITREGDVLRSRFVKE